MFIANAVLTAHIKPSGSVIRPRMPAKKAVSFVVSISTILLSYVTNLFVQNFDVIICHSKYCFNTLDHFIK